MSIGENHPHKCRLILVEDSQNDADLLQTFIDLEDIDLDVTHFLDGRSAYQYLSDLITGEQGAGGFVVLDLNLPKMSGKEILEKLNERGPTGSVHIMVFSGSDDLDDKRECLAHGAASYYVKPWDLDGYRRFIKGPFLRELREVCACV